MIGKGYTDRLLTEMQVIMLVHNAFSDDDMAGPDCIQLLISSTT